MFNQLLNNPIALIGISTLAAAIPAVIWLYIFFSKGEKSKKTVALIFFLGMLIVPADLGIQMLWGEFPRFNLAKIIETTFQVQSVMYLFTILLFASMEEIFKLYVVSAVDKRTLLINKINDALRYSIVAALAFAFAENIFYFYNNWPYIQTGEIVGMYIFRTIFTTCAHMIFSGIFGYYYGIGKFSIHISEQQTISEKPSKIAQTISKIFKLPLSEGYRQKLVVKGLAIAIFLHTVFNYLLQYNIVLPVIIFVILGYFYLRYLLSRQTGHLLLITDPTTQRTSTMAKKDEDVIIELIGMWFKDQRYLDVISICERLLARDPDNKVVKIFQANAMDQIQKKTEYSQLLGKLPIDRSVISKHIAEKEMFDRVKLKIRQILESQGKEFKNPKSFKETKKSKTANSPNAENELLKKYTGEGTFKIG